MRTFFRFAWGALPAVLLTTSAAAADLAEGLTVGGFGEAFGRYEHQQSDSVRRQARTSPGADWADFSADVDLKLNYRVDAFRLRTDILAFSDAPFADGNHLLLEQAFIDWTASEPVTIRAGRFQTLWLGWEGYHTPELWRVNHSAAWDWNVQNHALKPNRPFLSDGVGLLLTPVANTGAEFYVCDPMLGSSDTARGFDKTLGSSFWGKRDGVGRAELGVAYEARSANTNPDFATTGVNDAAHVLAVDLNADCTALKDQGWFFAAEVQYHHHPDLVVGDVTYGNDLVLLGMANYALRQDLSLTVMVDYVERGMEAPDNEVLETAVALLYRPHQQVRLNTEVFYWDERAESADMLGGAVVLNVTLP